MNPSGDPIEDYLDQLFKELRTAPRGGRRLLAEAEDHLREAVAGGLEAGMTQREAEEYAISSFGSVSAVVRAHDARTNRFPRLAVFRDLVMSGWLLGSVGLVAVGVSGVVAAVMNRVLGSEFVGGAPAGTRFTAAACQHFLVVQPTAHTCAQAAMLESSADAVSLRLLAGVAGLVLLGGYSLVRRIRFRSVLPDGFVPVVAVSVFGLAGLGLAFLSTGLFTGNGVLRAGPGPGFYLSGAIVALGLAGVYLLPLRRTLLHQLSGG